MAEACNTFRVYGDIDDAYQSIMSITNWYGDDPGNFSQVAGPGSFCDADMVCTTDLDKLSAKYNFTSLENIAPKQVAIL